jgi:hypothetical protein
MTPMRKHMPAYQRAILAAVIPLFLFAANAIAQVRFEASAPSQVALGQAFRISYSVNQEGKGFIMPEIRNFDVLMGPSQGSSSNISVINGKVTQSVSYSYTFVLQPQKAGSFTIPPASITVDGKKYLSNSLAIQVIDQGGGGQQSQPRQNARPRGTQPGTSGTISENDVFLRAAISKNNLSLGEQAIITYKLYTRIPLSLQGIDKIPSNTGFWSQDLLKDKDKYLQYDEVINGTKYMVAEIRKVAIFPQQTGKLTIDPLQVDVLAQIAVQSRSPFDDDPFFKNFFDSSPFGQSVQNVQKTLKSNPVTVNIAPLPSAGKPIDFTGAVGDFSLRSTIDHDQVKANEAITFRFTISGSGNLSLIEKPNITFPPDFEVYDPKIADNINATSSGISGSRTFEYLLIPRVPGDFTIKPVPFTYFDLSKRSYATLSSPQFDIKVTKGDGTEAGVITSTAREDIKYIGNDIRYIHHNVTGLHQAGKSFFGSWLFYLLFLLPFVLFGIFLVVWRKQLQLRSDTGLMRNRKANKVATARLKKAKSFLDAKQQEPFYEEVSQALWGYISDKFNIPLSELSLETAQISLEQRNVDESLSRQFIETLQHCEFARFAPGDKEAAMTETYNLALQNITNTEQKLK